MRSDSTWNHGDLREGASDDDTPNPNRVRRLCRREPWWALFLSAAAQFVVIAFGGLLLLGGRLADLFGQRRLFVGGFDVLALASILEPGEKGKAVTR